MNNQINYFDYIFNNKNFIEYIKKQIKKNLIISKKDYKKYKNLPNSKYLNINSLNYNKNYSLEGLPLF